MRRYLIFFLLNIVKIQAIGTSIFSYIVRKPAAVNRAGAEHPVDTGLAPV